MFNAIVFFLSYLCSLGPAHCLLLNVYIETNYNPLLEDQLITLKKIPSYCHAISAVF